MKHSDSYSGGVIFGILAFLLAAIIATAMFVLPQYGVWQQSLEGKAELQKAEYTRQVAVLEAQAKLDSAEKLRKFASKRPKASQNPIKSLVPALRITPSI